MAHGEFLVRPYRADDAPGIADLYNRYPDGPNRVDRKLDAAMVRTELSDRGTALFLVAEQQGQVRGTLGMFHSCGKRAAGPGEVFGDMFFLIPGLRGGAAAAHLFVEAVAPLAARGIRTIRLTTDPANRAAYSAYLQAGCSVVGDGMPDEDGAVELVNQVPVLVSLLRTHFPEVLPPDLPHAELWRRVITGVDGPGLVVGSARALGRPSVRNAVSCGPAHVAVHADPWTGEVFATAVGDGAVREAPDARAPAVRPDLPAGPAPAAHGGRGAYAGPTTVRSGRLCLSLDPGDGTVTLHHGDHLGPLLSDPWPVNGPPYATGWRRPAAGRRLGVTAWDDGWTVTERHPGGVLTRDSRLWGGSLVQSLYWTPDAPAYAEGGAASSGAVRVPVPVSAPCLRSALTVGLRSSVLVQGQSPGTVCAPAGRNLWPVDATDFAAAGHEVTPGRRLSWWAPYSGLSVTVEWDGGIRARLLSSLLLLLDSAPGCAYRVDVSRSHGGAQAEGRVPVAVPGVAPPDGAGGGALPASAQVPQRPLPRREPAAQARWTPATAARRAVHRMAVGDDEVLCSAESGGIVSWRRSGARVLASPFPRFRAFGPNAAWRSGLWVTRQPVREDLRHGAGWGVPPPGSAWSFDASNGVLSEAGGTAADGGTASSEALAWSFALCAEGPWSAVVTSAAEPDGGTEDVVVWLTPASGREGRALTSGGPGDLWRLERAAPWQQWCREAALELADGRWLVTTALRAEDEVLVRRTAHGPLLALFARRPAHLRFTARMPLLLADDEESAVRHLRRHSGSSPGASLSCPPDRPERGR